MTNVFIKCEACGRGQWLPVPDHGIHPPRHPETTIETALNYGYILGLTFRGDGNTEKAFFCMSRHCSEQETFPFHVLPDPDFGI